jgi:hypothetical protein
MTVTSLWDRVLKISARMKRSGTTLLPAPKEKQVRLDAGLPLSPVRPQVMAGIGDDGVDYCAILDSVPSELSSSSGETFGSVSIVTSPPPVPNLRTSAEPSPALKGEVASHGIPAEARVSVVAPKGLVLLFHGFC